MILDLLKDIGRFLAEAPTRVRKGELVRLAADAIRRNAQFLTEHPTSLFQSIANSLSFSEHAGRTPLARLLESWRLRGDPCRRPWLRSLSPLPGAEDSPVVQVLAHHGEVQAISASPDGRFIAVASSKKGAGIHTRIWFTSTWELLVELLALETGNENAGVRWIGFDHYSRMPS